MIERTAQDPHVVGMRQIRGQDRLGRLVPELAPEVSAAQPAAQDLLGNREGIPEISTVDHRHHTPGRIADYGMAHQFVAVAVQIRQDDRIRVERGGWAARGRADPLTQVLVTALQVGGGHCVCGGAGWRMAQAARQFLVG